MLLAAEISADLKRLFSGLRTKTPLRKKHFKPIIVLTHKNSLLSKELYRTVFDRSELVFDMVTFLGSIQKLKKKIVCQKFSIE